MCIIIHQETKSNYAIENFDRAWNENRDGMGLIGWTGDKKIRIEKTLDKTEAKRIVESACSECNKLIVHFRLATHGEKSIHNVHPFETHGGALYTMHNGIFSGYGSVDNSISDTADWINHHVRSISLHNLHKAINYLAEISKGSRLALIQHGGNVIRTGEWITLDGGQVHLSNASLVESRFSWRDYMADYSRYCGVDHDADPFTIDQGLCAICDDDVTHLTALICETCAAEQYGLYYTNHTTINPNKKNRKENPKKKEGRVGYLNDLKEGWLDDTHR